MLISSYTTSVTALIRSSWRWTPWAIVYRSARAGVALRMVAWSYPGRSR